MLNSQPDFYFVGDPCKGTYVTDGHGTYYELHDVTGTLVIFHARERRKKLNAFFFAYFIFDFSGSFAEYASLMSFTARLKPC